MQVGVYRWVCTSECVQVGVYRWVCTGEWIQVGGYRWVGEYMWVDVDTPTSLSNLLSLSTPVDISSVL